MSKKKATMTLKDFHGGSIPSDLPLPSAPGLIVRPSDRVGFDRQTPWGNPMGRPDHRLRPGSAGTQRNFDEKTPFLTPSTRIGRNFDEDERKPLDGGSAPRRTVSDDSIPALPIRVEPKSDYVSGRPGSTPGSQFSGGTASSYAARFVEPVHVSESRSLGLNLNHHSIGGNNGPVGGGSYPNAWGLRKDAVAVGGAEAAPPSWSAPDAATKLAHASALEKVSSGRWHSKQPQPVHHRNVDVEVIRHPETESGAYSMGHSLYYKSTHDATDLRTGREFNAVDGKELLVYNRTMSPIYSETKERRAQMYVDVEQPPRNAGKFVGSELQSPVLSESVERPKLKLLPRSKPSENVESYFDYKQGYQPPSDPRLIDNGIETNENAYPAKPGLAGSDIVNRAVERPKLSLKPRSQHHEQLEVNPKRERNSVFGGARPRELVLKERGIDDVALSNQSLGQSPNKVKPDVPWTETGPARATPTHHNEKAENTPLDHRIRKNIDKRDHKSNTEKSDAQRRNWRNENQRSSREPEKHHHQQLVQSQPPPQRPRSPETWRKPVEQPPSRDAPGPRYRKAASAVELAQAFSRSISDPKTADRFSGQRGLPGHVEVPFSRLTGPQPRPQINGY
ncbi:hypothetical protein LguiA_015088 [Lonicera macranthoides]